MEHDNIHDKQDLKIFKFCQKISTRNSYIDPNDLQLFFRDMIYKMYVDKVIVMVHERFQDKLDLKRERKKRTQLIQENFSFFTK